MNDLVLVKDPDSAVFEPRYLPNYRIIAIHGKNRIEVQDEKGHKSVIRSGHVKPCHPAAKVCHQLPPQEVYEQYGRTSKLLIHPKDVPHIPLEVFKEEQEVEKTKNNDTELSSVDSLKEPLVDDHDDSGSRAENETTMDDVKRHQCVSEVCALELYSEDDDTDTSDDSRNRSPKRLTGNRKREVHKNHANFREKDSDVDTSDDSKNRSPRRLSGTWKGEGHESHIDLTKKNSDINITDELTSWLQVGEGNNQAKPSKNSDVNDRYVDNIDTSGNRQRKLKYRVSNGPGGNKGETSIDCRATGDRPACCARAQAGASSLLPTLTSTVNKVPSLAFSKLKIRSTSKSVKRKGKAGKFLQSSLGLNLLFKFSFERTISGLKLG